MSLLHIIKIFKNINVILQNQVGARASTRSHFGPSLQIPRGINNTPTYYNKKEYFYNKI